MTLTVYAPVVYNILGVIAQNVPFWLMDLHASLYSQTLQPEWLILSNQMQRILNHRSIRNASHHVSNHHDISSQNNCGQTARQQQQSEQQQPRREVTGAARACVVSKATASTVALRAVWRAPLWAVALKGSHATD